MNENATAPTPDVGTQWESTDTGTAERPANRWRVIGRVGTESVRVQWLNGSLRDDGEPDTYVWRVEAFAAPNMLRLVGDEAIDRLRRRLHDAGWTIDPRDAGGNPYVHQIGLEANGHNVTARYRTPHAPSLTSEGSRWYTMRASLCEGGGWGGRVVMRDSTTQCGPFGRHKTPGQWADESFAALESLRHRMLALRARLRVTLRGTRGVVEGAAFDVDTLAEAAAVVSRVRDEYPGGGLGSRDLAGADVARNGRPYAWVSYNGRVWTGPTGRTLHPDGPNAGEDADPLAKR